MRSVSEVGVGGHPGAITSYKSPIHRPIYKASYIYLYTGQYIRHHISTYTHRPIYKASYNHLYTGQYIRHPTWKLNSTNSLGPFPSPLWPVHRIPLKSSLLTAANSHQTVFPSHCLMSVFALGVQALNTRKAPWDNGIVHYAMLTRGKSRTISQTITQGKYDREFKASLTTRTASPALSTLMPHWQRN